MSWLYRLAQQCVYFIEMTTLLKLTDSLWGREELTKPTCIASSMVYHKHKSANLSNDTSFSKKERKKENHKHFIIHRVFLLQKKAELLLNGVFVYVYMYVCINIYTYVLMLIFYMNVCFILKKDPELELNL